MRKIFVIFLMNLMIAAPAMSDSETAEVKDCFEGLNRATFAFNQGLDKAIFKPIAKGYRKLPSPIRTGTGNVVSNLSNLITIPNKYCKTNIKYHSWYFWDI